MMKTVVLLIQLLVDYVTYRHDREQLHTWGVDKVLFQLQYHDNLYFNSPPAAPIGYNYASNYASQDVPQSQHLALSQRQPTSHVTFPSPLSLIPQATSGTKEHNFDY